MLNRKRSGTESTNSPARKRSKPNVKPIDDACREYVLKQKNLILENLKRQYHDYLAELSFLQAGSQMTDYYSWRNSRSEQMMDVLRSGALDEDDLNEVNKLASGARLHNFFPLPAMAAQNYSINSDCQSLDDLDDQDIVRFIPCESKISGSEAPRQRERSDSSKRLRSESDLTVSSVVENGTVNGLNDEETAQREIVEKARQEATAMQRVAQLRKAGLWSARRLPKVAEPPRRKAHWDYVLEEMQWLAVDFAQERKWKKAAARKIVYAIQKKFKEREDNEKRAEREEINRKKRIASSMARMVREWWQNIGKVVQYKQKSRLQEMRKKALDVHLNYIVDQTERFSEWLTEGMQQTTQGRSDMSSGGEGSRSGSDEDFDPDTGNLTSEDDEETIAKAEAEDLDSGNDAVAELDALRQESEIPLDELLNSLPPGMLSQSPRSEDMSVSEGESEDDTSVQSEDADNESTADDESTMEEQEKHENDTGEAVKEEIAALEEEADLPLEELISKYGGIDALKSPSGDEMALSSCDSDEDDSSESLDDGENESAKESSDEETEKAEDSSVDSFEETEGKEDSDTEETRLTALLATQKDTLPESACPSEPSTDAGTNGAVSEVERNFSALAAEAESLQPTGYTLESTEIKIRVPFLIKHTLREYQHVGLDWLATMYDKRLNGILADEMGLGKTIQTIALLAHLACEKGIWGPHLIVVPTSVMLNWELEFKKWCPAFKILTYFGSQKERKEKRKGWTKTNAFHVCITSYKLAIQDHSVFKRKKWKYLCLDEAQNIKNFKSKRWQTLLTFNSQRRLLLTGTPLQNSLMELWSLMHFLMPHVFQSHREFREWFANPLTGMIEGSQEYNELIVKRLHKVLRPFILRRLKKDVEKQMPQKYEHVVMCRLSRRQRFLYDDFMSRASTKDSLSSGHFMSVINILMQLRKVCNHPNLFEPRPTVSPFKMSGISYSLPSLILNDIQYRPMEDVDIRLLFPNLVEMENNLPTFVSERIKQLKAPRRLIEEVDCVESIPPKDQCCATYSETNLPYLTKPFIPRDVIKKLRAELSAQSTEDLRQGKPQGSNVPQATPLDQLPGYIPNRRAQNFKAPDWTACFRISSSEAPSENRHLPAAIISERRSVRRSQLKLIATLNDRRCEGTPLYGCNLVNRLQFVGQQPVRPLGRVVSLRKATFLSRGYHNAYWAQCQRERTRGRMHWCSCSPLEAIVNRPEDHLAQLQDIVNRFVFCIPTVWSSGPTMTAAHLPNQQLMWERYQEPQLRREVSPKMDILHTVYRQQTVRFAEARLIQYDCGKLQTLDLLLRKLKKDDHRILIFTQMTKMLDVLEQFLSYHGHRYLRLDGTTRVEQRQALMERFNADNRIFCFILSTRSGGLGVNLTGADTVIFYDSDWNPTMDAQAQDRCHRIGQTRDVHIYRLISEKTIEENILKKANQKRFLSDVAIEGGKFTTAHFRQNTLRELFAEPSGLEDFVREKNATATDANGVSEGEASSSEATDLERCLEECEDDNDRMAASKARAEAKAELAEFDETIAWDEQEASAQASAEPVSLVEAELQALENELAPIERYAVSFIEINQGGNLEDELEQAENQIEEAKRNWELEHAKALRDAEEMRAEEEEDDMLYCYGAYDITSQCFMTEESGDIMPLIAPPSPVEEDFYVDDCLALMYESTVMTESQLPNFWSGRDKLMYSDLLVTPTPATAAPSNTLVPPKQVALVPRERGGPGHTIVKRRKLGSSNVPGIPGAPNLVRQGSCGAPAVVAGAPTRPPVGPSLVPSRHYRNSGAGSGTGLKAGIPCATQILERERPITVNTSSGPAVASAAAAASIPSTPGAGSNPPQAGERLSSTAQAAQLRSMLPRTVFQRDSAGTHKMRGRMPPYPSRHRTGLPVRGHSLGPLVHSKLHQEWTAHEESALFTSLTQLQDIHFNSAMAERYPCWQVHTANFLLAEFFINTYSRPRCFRSHRQIMSHYESLQTSLSTGQHAGGPSSASALLASGNSVGGSSASAVGGLSATGNQGLHAEPKQGHPGVKMKRKSSVAATGQHRFRALTTPSGADNPAAAAAMANSAEGKYASWLGVAKTVGKRKRPPGLGPPGAGNSVATQGIVQRNSLHVAALQENGINPDLLLGPMQIIKAKEEREQRMKEQQSEHPGVSVGGSSQQPGILPPSQAVSSTGFAHPSNVAAAAAAAAAHKLQVASSLGQAGPSQAAQQQRILVAGPAAAAAGVSAAGAGSNLAALQRRGGVITTQGTAAALSAAALRRSTATGATMASVATAQSSPRILQRPQGGNTVQMASLIRQQQLSGMTQVAKRSAAGQAGPGGAAGVSASGQPTASARIQALTAGAATTVAMVSQAGGGQQFRAAGISVNPAGAAQARLVTATGTAGMVGHGGSAPASVNSAQVAAIIRAKQAQVAAAGHPPTLVKSLSCAQRLQAGGGVAGQAAGAGTSMGTPVQIIQPGGQRGMQTTVTVQQIQQLIRHQGPNVQHIISSPQTMATSAGLRRASATAAGAASAGEHIVISRYPSASVAPEASGVQASGIGTDLGPGPGGGGSVDASGVKESAKKD